MYKSQQRRRRRGARSCTDTEAFAFGDDLMIVILIIMMQIMVIVIFIVIVIVMMIITKLITIILTIIITILSLLLLLLLLLLLITMIIITRRRCDWVLRDVVFQDVASNYYFQNPSLTRAIYLSNAYRHIFPYIH